MDRQDLRVGLLGLAGIAAVVVGAFLITPPLALVAIGLTFIATARAA